MLMYKTRAGIKEEVDIRGIWPFVGFVNRSSGPCIIYVLHVMCIGVVVILKHIKSYIWTFLVRGK